MFWGTLPDWWLHGYFSVFWGTLSDLEENLPQTIDFGSLGALAAPRPLFSFFWDPLGVSLLDEGSRFLSTSGMIVRGFGYFWNEGSNF